MNDLVENLIDRLKIEFEKKDKSGVYGETQRMLAYNSNRIEGSTLTYLILILYLLVKMN